MVPRPAAAASPSPQSALQTYRIGSPGDGDLPSVLEQPPRDAGTHQDLASPAADSRSAVDRLWLDQTCSAACFVIAHELGMTLHFQMVTF